MTGPMLRPKLIKIYSQDLNKKRIQQYMFIEVLASNYEINH